MRIEIEIIFRDRAITTIDIEGDISPPNNQKHLRYIYIALKVLVHPNVQDVVRG